MPNLEIDVLSTESQEWKDIWNKHGDGKVKDRYDYKTECTTEKFPNHRVLRGKWPDNSLTGTGFLRDAAGKVVGGVNQLP